MSYYFSSFFLSFPSVSFYFPFIFLLNFFKTLKKKKLKVTIDSDPQWMVIEDNVWFHNFRQLLSHDQTQLLVTMDNLTYNSNSFSPFLFYFNIKKINMRMSKI